ncbi:MAG: bifunctional precorrin-2 dehydrogenase/sirohydrochlorin ferrochelatase [Spirochaetes bacterium]|nr:bifunctional precorrin-2 dehydrogenase/sirohydrochlorin ferrochelatase [Spirochaetota bacterium]
MLLPLSFDLTHREVLLVGGGRAALEKFAQLDRTACNLTIVAPHFSTAMDSALINSQLQAVRIEKRRFEISDLDNKFMVFSAVDDRAVAEIILDHCRKRKILLNSADDRAHCDFYTTAVIKRGNVQIAVSTGGRFAGLSAILRRHLETLFPAELDDQWENIFCLRERALALHDINEKKSVITDIVNLIETRYFARSSGETSE